MLEVVGYGIAPPLSFSLCHVGTQLVHRRLKDFGLFLPIRSMFPVAQTMDTNRDGVGLGLRPTFGLGPACQHKRPQLFGPA